jgi:hypothetical protein
VCDQKLAYALRMQDEESDCLDVYVCLFGLCVCTFSSVTSWMGSLRTMGGGADAMA